MWAWTFIKELCFIEIDGNLPRKSNSRQIVRKGGKGGALMVIKSEIAQRYTQEFALQLRQNYPELVQKRWGSWDKPLGLDVVVFYRSRRSDLSIELLKDLLEANGVIANDRFIRWEMAEAYIDKDNPRVLLRLFEIAGEDYDE